jgi:dihydroxyacetone kinase
LIVRYALKRGGHARDVMKFEMAAEMYVGNSATVLTNDDVAVESSRYSHTNLRRS